MTSVYDVIPGWVEELNSWSQLDSSALACVLDAHMAFSIIKTYPIHLSDVMLIYVKQ